MVAHDRTRLIDRLPTPFFLSLVRQVTISSRLIVLACASPMLCLFFLLFFWGVRRKYIPIVIKHFKLPFLSLVY
jgi:hypothetical protein